METAYLEFTRVAAGTVCTENLRSGMAGKEL